MRCLRSTRLTLRPLAAADASTIADLAGDWDVARMTGRIPYPYSAEMAMHWMTELADGEVVYGIERDGALIGLCGFTPEAERCAEIGYWIGRPYWGNGYATEAARTLMRDGYTKFGLRRFQCSHFTDNPASRRVIEKLGFRQIENARGWCEARQLELPTIRYEHRRPFLAALKALAS